MDLDAKLCYCFHISKRKVVNFIRQRQPKRASQVSECFGAGTGCGWCVPFLKKLHREIVGDGIVEGDDITPEEYEALRAAYRQEVAAGTRSRNQYAGGESSEGDDDGESFDDDFLDDSEFTSPPASTAPTDDDEPEDNFRDGPAR